jgi:seryl-tRNA synthetase
MKGGKPEQSLVDEGKQIKLELGDREEYLRNAEAETLDALKKVPNMPLDFVPIGASEDDNVVTKTVISI